MPVQDFVSPKTREQIGLIADALQIVTVVCSVLYYLATSYPLALVLVLGLGVLLGILKRKTGQVHLGLMLDLGVSISKQTRTFIGSCVSSLSQDIERLASATRAAVHTIYDALTDIPALHFAIDLQIGLSKKT